LPLIAFTAFPDRFAFDCYDMDASAAAEGYKDPDWHVFAESRNPTDVGRSTGCTASGTDMNMLTCKIQWFNVTTSTDLTLNYDPTAKTANGNLVSVDGKSHVFTNCVVR